MDGTQRCRIEFGLAAQESARSGAKRVRKLHNGIAHVAGVHPLQVHEQLHRPAGGVCESVICVPFFETVIENVLPNALT